MPRGTLIWAHQATRGTLTEAVQHSWEGSSAVQGLLVGQHNSSNPFHHIFITGSRGKHVCSSRTGVQGPATHPWWMQSSSS